MELTLNLIEDTIYLIETDHMTRYKLLRIPEYLENHSRNPVIQPRPDGRTAVRDAFISLAERMFREINEGKADSRLLVPGLQIMGKVFTESVRGCRIRKAGCIGFEADGLYQWLRQGLLYFDPDAKLTGIETNLLTESVRLDLDCYMQGSVKDTLSLIA